MSKKLIAVAAAAALALTGLVASPASAYSFTYTENDSVGTNTGSSSKPFKHASPETNVVEATSSIEFTVNTTQAAASAFSVTASGGVRLLEALLDADGEKVKVGAGATSLTNLKASVTASASFYAYTTSTTAGKVIIKTADKEEVVYVASTVGTPYNVSAKFPPALNPFKASDIDVTVTDVFGNKHVETTAVAFSAGTLTTGVNGAADIVAPDAYTWHTTRKVWVGKVIGKEAAGPASVSVTLGNGSFDSEANGLPAPKLIAFNTLSAADLAAQISALQAQVASMVTKKRFNTLARKWNAAFPGDNVKLKK